jgi:hypothetical protein
MSDLRVMGDVLIASLLAPVARLIVQKAFLEPAAAWPWQTGLKKAIEGIRQFWARKPEQSR